MHRVFTVGVRFIFIGIILLGAMNQLQAQDWQAKADSLRQATIAMPTDSLQVRSWLKLMKLYRNRDMDSAYTYGHIALETARKVGIKKQEARMLASLGNLYMLDGRYEETLGFNYEALALFQESGTARGVGGIHIGIGSCLIELGQYDSALVHFKHGLEIMQKAGSPTDVSIAHSNLSTAYYQKGDLHLALKHMTISSEMDDSIANRSGSTTVKTNIAIIHTQMGNFDQALGYLFEVLRIKENLQDIRGQANALANIAGTYSSADSLDLAWNYCQKAMGLAKQIGSKETESRILISLGAIHRKRNQYDQAKEVLEQAMALKDSIGQLKDIAEIKIELGEVYQKLGNTELAKIYIESAATESKLMGNKTLEKRGYRLLSEIYAQSGEYKKAYSSLLAFKNIQADLLNSQKQSQVIRYQEKYESEKKQREIDLLIQQDRLKAIEIEQRKTRTTYTRLGIGAGALIVILVILLLFNTVKAQKRSKENLDKENERLQDKNKGIQLEKENLELHAMLARMNPHFIFNSLNSIQRFIANREQKSAHDYLHKFSLLIRTILNHSNKNWVPLSEVLEALEYYIALELARVNHKFEFEMQIDPSVDVFNLKVPPLLIQPYVENAIWHGLMPLEGRAGRLVVQLKDGEDRLHCKIEDNGIGRKQSQASKLDRLPGQESQGMGITLRRLNALWAQRDEVNEVKITDLSADSGQALGTRVELLIPIDF